MEFFKQNTAIDFLALKKCTAVVSILLILASFIALGIKGLNWGLDFTGGTQIQVSYAEAADFNKIREQLQQAGYVATVQGVGAPQNALIRIPPLPEAQQKDLSQTLLNTLPGASIQHVEYIGPVVGETLTNNGLLALVVSLLATLIYVALRFEWRFAVSGVIALLHDPIIILGVFAVFQIEFNLVALAALLTVIGYSLNDTIVIFDRIRENFRRVRTATAVEIVNLSVNQTLSRTVMTSGLTLLSVIALFLFG